MALPTVPLTIPSPIAVSGVKNTIPVDTPAGTGALSYNAGFPPLVTGAVGAGLMPPATPDLNGALNVLSQHTYWQQSGALYPWDATKDYVVDCRVTHRGLWYRAIANSGPSAGGAKDPLTSPDTWLVDFSIHNNAVYYIDYSATTPGNGMYSTSPAQNLSQLMTVLRGVHSGIPIFSASAEGYTATPSVYIQISGTGDITETIDYGLNIEHVNVTFAFQSGITSWTLNTGFFFGVNAGIRMDCATPLTINLPPTQFRNCFWWGSANATIKLSGNTYINIIGSDISLPNLDISTSISNGVPFLLYTSNAVINNFNVNNTVPNTSSTCFVVSSVFHVNSCTTYNSSNNIASMHTVSSYAAFINNGTYAFSTLNANNSAINFNSGTIKIGNITGQPAPDNGMIVTASILTLNSGVAIAPGDVIPAKKGYVTRWGSVQALGIAPDTWPGTQSWTISAQGYYQS